ncbi:hypothetical protein A1Q1_07880 [Trichosporon asahii var. asahii CBS 2479]|uniref:NADH:ubiquinone oxidoreductase intermediate-associated protein 30 domain-containing protein n=1 Tax=Trichosporon asahii var. asahii (strain ATCC 90039 / CBS 2479 / JCM 2466 / KCTC 7840 / NBRC 103889/ NCYC 2677 / UAMH 7654) TaxID=1186058 RepID=J6F6F6_TRIAS|nr:hypothetical protein A1Q1_07880 [Trichosporon asahii var. asahii CBS 2479]EJT50907.1 hypothetical protein A1Q1_07880 [Trichosporon asahii var. asahii CBS 2479]
MSFAQRLNRSLDGLKRNTGKGMWNTASRPLTTSAVLRMNPDPHSGALPIFSFTADSPPVNEVGDFALGSDLDIGGQSTCVFTQVSDKGDNLGEIANTDSGSVAQLPSSAGSAADDTGPSGGAYSAQTQHEEKGKPSHASFHGILSLNVPAEHRGKIRTGYAAFRNRKRQTLMGEETWDLDRYTHLRVELAYRGWDVWRSRWVCNLQTDGPVRSDLFQHRLDLPSEYASKEPTPMSPLKCTGLNFTTVHLPLDGFVLTNSGQTSEKQIKMMQNKIRTIGFALLGGGRSAENEAPAALEAESEAPKNKYHKVGGGAPTSEGMPTDHQSEGYYELCIRKVDAVRWNTEDE